MGVTYQLLCSSRARVTTLDVGVGHVPAIFHHPPMVPGPAVILLPVGSKPYPGKGKLVAWPPPESHQPSGWCLLCLAEVQHVSWLPAVRVAEASITAAILAWWQSRGDNAWSPSAKEGWDNFGDRSCRHYSCLKCTCNGHIMVCN